MNMSEKMGNACCGDEEEESCVPLPRVGGKINISSGEDAFAAHDSIYGSEHSVEAAWSWHEYEAAKNEELYHGL